MAVSRFSIGTLGVAMALLACTAEAHGPYRHYPHPRHIAWGWEDAPPPPLWPAPWEEVRYLPPPAPDFPMEESNQTGTSAYCREYTDHAIINGRPQPTYGTACWQPDGSWQIQR